jgi:16S rRNA (guanine527-N7)-methyltransferase
MPRALIPTAEAVAATRSRLEQLADQHGIGRLGVEQLEDLLRLVATEDQSPTAVSDPVRAVDVHVADSLTGLDIPIVRAARDMVDIGAGAGFPGLPLGVAVPEARIRLLDSSTRACQFLRRAVRTARVSGAEVVHGRAEAWPEGLGAHDVALARALAPLPVVLEYAAPLLRISGGALVWRGARNAPEERSGAAAARILGLELAEVRRTHPFPGARAHYLHLYLKVEATPARFPRRPGVAVKRPLGS